MAVNIAPVQKINTIGPLVDFQNSPQPSTSRHNLAFRVTQTPSPLKSILKPRSKSVEKFRPILRHIMEPKRADSLQDLAIKRKAIVNPDEADQANSPKSARVVRFAYRSPSDKIIEKKLQRNKSTSEAQIPQREDFVTVGRRAQRKTLVELLALQRAKSLEDITRKKQEHEAKHANVLSIKRFLENNNYERRHRCLNGLSGNSALEFFFIVKFLAEMVKPDYFKEACKLERDRKKYMEKFRELTYNLTIETNFSQRIYKNYLLTPMVLKKDLFENFLLHLMNLAETADASSQGD